MDSAFGSRYNHQGRTQNRSRGRRETMQIGLRVFFFESERSVDSRLAIFGREIHENRAGLKHSKIVVLFFFIIFEDINFKSRSRQNLECLIKFFEQWKSPHRSFLSYELKSVSMLVRFASNLHKTVIAATAI